ncbi:MAG: ferrous iron transport protein B [Bacteroidales bacterium]|nr:ferrous iron transport protein B [Bacteroidales bacterium]
MTLFDLEEGEEGIILKIKGRGRFRQRLSEMGFVVGKKIKVIRKAPLRDPVEYMIMGYNLSLRNSEAQLIEVDRKNTLQPPLASSGVIVYEEENDAWVEKTKHIQIAFVGNPNSGKTTLFNYASGSREKVGNYAGVTVDYKEAAYEQSGYTFSIVDLPGAYSLKSYSPEEVYVRNYIFKNKPDVIVNIVEAANLERSLYLTTQLIDMGVQTVIALNMYDELEKSGNSLDTDSLENLFGVPVIPTTGTKGKGLRQLFDTIISVYENRQPVVRHIHINYGDDIENAIRQIQVLIKADENKNPTNTVSARYFALEALANDKELILELSCFHNSTDILKTVNRERSRLEKLYSEPPETVITDLRYGFISGALKETLKINRKEKHGHTDSIDNYLINKYLGFPVFLIFMLAAFYTTFKLGSYPQQWLETGVSSLGNLIVSSFPKSILRDFAVDGIIGGVGGVLVFLPNIVILFLFISFMEDTGYMARAVFIMDRIMHKIGLHGKSFIPLFMGFGCNVPAVLATRIIESRSDRMITMLITPFMSCSARLPVYILFISAFFSASHGFILFILYLLGTILAIVSALILRKIFFKSVDVPFVMELPPYRIPTPRSIVKHVVFRTGLYLKKIGGIILIASVVIWILSYFPQSPHFEEEYNRQTAIINESNLGTAEKQEALDRLDTEKANKRQEGSFMGMIGRQIEPLMQPLGFDWRLSVAVISGVAAKEIVVSALGVLFQAGSDAETASLVEKIQAQQDCTGRPLFNPVAAFSFMLFILVYFPCIGVVAAIKRESGSWKWATFTVVYTTALAWLLSLIAYQAGSALFL